MLQNFWILLTSGWLQLLMYCIVCLFLVLFGSDAINRYLIWFDVFFLSSSYANQTPLCLAVFLNQPEVVRLLIECKADVNVQLQKRLESGLGMRCYNLIHFAASRGQHWIGTLSELLSSKDINLHSINSEGMAVFVLADRLNIYWFKKMKN